MRFIKTTPVPLSHTNFHPPQTFFSILYFFKHFFIDFTVFSHSLYHEFCPEKPSSSVFTALNTHFSYSLACWGHTTLHWQWSNDHSRFLHILDLLSSSLFAWRQLSNAVLLLLHFLQTDSKLENRHLNQSVHLSWLIDTSSQFNKITLHSYQPIKQAMFTSSHAVFPPQSDYHDQTVAWWCV